MRIENDPKLDFDDVLIRPKRSVLGSRKDVDLTREFQFKYSKERFDGVPIIAANMDTIATFEMADALREHSLGAALHKHYEIDELVEYFQKIEEEHTKLVRRKDGRDTVFYSMGILDQDCEKLNEFLEKKFSFDLPYLCVDVANGYSERFKDVIKQLREKYPDTTIMAGNVVTGEMTEQLILSGADIVKVGIGPGSVCTTRKMTGVGYPQLSAIIECADAAHGIGGLVCADGGCKVPGDIAKAFGAGADFVMLGGMLAGHDECKGEFIRDVIDIKPSGAYEFSEPTGMKFYGMSSKEAMNKHSGGVADYRATEGKEVIVPYRGPVSNTIQQILGGLRSACTYTGARRLKDLSKCTTFVQVNRQLNTKYGDD
jgi:GMP reductase